MATANTPNNTLHDRAVGAAIRFLERKYWHDIERINCAPFDIVARDGETVVFVHVKAETNGSFPDEPTRADYERGMIAYMLDNPGAIEPDCAARIDTVTMIVVGDDRALLRHHVNAARFDR